jgi:hypothetical protein
MLSLWSNRDKGARHVRGLDVGSSGVTSARADRIYKPCSATEIVARTMKVLAKNISKRICEI